MSNHSVYTGVWTDWSLNSSSRSRLTLTSASGNLVIAFLALFVRLVGGQVWSLLSFAIHQVRVTDRPQEGLYHQFQVLLRNTTSSETFALKALMELWAWKGRTRGTGRWSTAYLLAALANSAAFTVASIYSSQIATTFGAVLLQGSHCGYWKLPAFPTLQQYLLGQVEDTLLLSQAEMYASNCYANTGTAAESCATYVQPRLTWTVRTADCPFREGLCSVPDALQLDTGSIDSALDLGINEPERNRVVARRVNTCSPITTAGFLRPDLYQSWTNASLHQAWGDIPINSSVSFYYGATPQGSQATFTYFYRSYASYNPPYLVQSVYPSATSERLDTDNEASSVSSPDGFTPDSKLIDVKVPVTLVFLADRVAYSSEVDDPWFKTVAVGGGFQASSLVSVLGCTEETQYCNPTRNINACTFLGANKEFDSSSFEIIGLNSEQTETALRIQTALSASTLGTVPRYLQQNSLLASQLLTPNQSPRSGHPVLNNYISPGLPSDQQWKAEVQNWQSISMGHLQMYSMSFANGPLTPEVLQWIQKPNNTASLAMCSNQKILSSAYTTFSVAGLAVVLTIGGLLTILNLTLPTFVAAIQKRAGRGQELRRSWAADNVLQVQRAFYEQVGLGGIWRGVEALVPVTALNERFRAPISVTRMDASPLKQTNYGFGKQNYKTGQESLILPFSDGRSSESSRVSWQDGGIGHGYCGRQD